MSGRFNRFTLFVTKAINWMGLFWLTDLFSKCYINVAYKDYIVYTMEYIWKIQTEAEDYDCLCEKYNTKIKSDFFLVFFFVNFCVADRDEVVLCDHFVVLGKVKKYVSLAKRKFIFLWTSIHGFQGIELTNYWTANDNLLMNSVICMFGQHIIVLYYPCENHCFTCVKKLSCAIEIEISERVWNTSCNTSELVCRHGAWIAIFVGNSKNNTGENIEF